MAPRHAFALGFAAVFMLTLHAVPAHAYSYESLISDGCHEKLARDTLRAARAADCAAPIKNSAADAALIGEAPFSLDADMRDIGAFAFLVGIRDNDLKGRAPTDSTTLATIHGNPHGQREHCLRRHENDEPNGTKEVIDECRAFIEELIDHAIDAGIDEATGLPDPNARTRVGVYLAFSGHVEAMLPIFYVYMGEALHVVQDSFTHMYRVGPKFEQITVALNWVDVVENDYDERRDGPPHMSALDQCGNLDAYREARLGAARQASIALFSAAIDPATAKAKRNAHAHEILDEYFSYKPGCTYDTRWCDAPENQYRPAEGGCSVAGGGSLTGLVAVFLTALAAVLGRRARRAAAAVALTLACLVAPRLAFAQSAEAPVKTVDATGSGWAFATSGSAAIDRPGFVISAGVRRRLGDGWLIGGDVEWNPWMSLESKTIQPGTLDVYATLIRRFRITDNVYLRTTGHLGASAMLFSLYGAPAGTIGPYVGLSLLGIEIKASRSLRIVFDPADVALPIPHLNGAPLSYRQYRLTLGFEFGG
jgi:hypothetical protein